MRHLKQSTNLLGENWQNLKHYKNMYSGGESYVYNIHVYMIPHSYHTYIHIYRSKVSNIRRTLLGNEIVDHSDVVGASPVGAAPTTSSFST